MSSFISVLPENRPRELLHRSGAQNLSDRDLLSIIISTGIKGKDVSILAKEAVELIDREDPTHLLKKLATIKGIGASKAALIVASLEFARRRLHTDSTKIRSPQDVVALLGHIKDRSQEHLVSITLNGAHEVIKSRIVSIGTANSTIAHPREIFNCAIKDGACAIVLAHNHPSGNCEPSEDDKKTTARIIDAGKLLGISLLDHVIIGRSDFYSFKDKGFI